MGGSPCLPHDVHQLVHHLVHCGDQPCRALERSLLLHQIDRFFVQAYTAQRFALGFQRLLHDLCRLGVVLGGGGGGGDVVDDCLVVVLHARAAQGGDGLALQGGDGEGGLVVAFLAVLSGGDERGLIDDLLVHRNV